MNFSYIINVTRMKTIQNLSADFAWAERVRLTYLRYQTIQKYQKTFKKKYNKPTKQILT